MARRKATKKPTAETKTPNPESKPPVSETPGISAEMPPGPELATEPAKRDYDLVDAGTSCCRKCLSTNRERYFGKPMVKEFDTPQTRPNGRVFNRLVKRRTRCKHCGQFRFDLSYEFDPAKVATDVEKPAFIGAAETA